MAARKRKPAAKKPATADVLVPQKHGGALKVGGTHPRTGRPRNAWKARLTGLASHQQVIEHLRKVLNKGPKDPNFFRALDYVTDHGYGRAQQPVDVTSNGQTLAGLAAQAYGAPGALAPEGTPGDDPE